MSYLNDPFIAFQVPTADEWNQLWANDAAMHDGTGIADSSILPKHLLTGTGSSWVYGTWVPTWDNLTLGNGTVVARWSQIGKRVHFHLQLTWGSTTSLSTSDTQFTLPANLHSSYNKQFSAGIGTGTAWRGATAYPVLVAAGNGATKVVIQAIKTNGGVGSIYAQEAGYTSAAPSGSWTTGDVLEVSGTYEAA